MKEITSYPAKTLETIPSFTPGEPAKTHAEKISRRGVLSTLIGTAVGAGGLGVGIGEKIGEDYARDQFSPLITAMLDAKITGQTVVGTHSIGADNFEFTVRHIERERAQDGSKPLRKPPSGSIEL